MGRYETEKLKVKDVEAIVVILAVFYLFQQRLKQYVDWYYVKVLVQLNKVKEHHFSDIHFPIKLN